MPKLVCLLMLLSAGAVAQTVEGNVLNSATGAGIGGVKVEIVKGGWLAARIMPATRLPTIGRSARRGIRGCFR
jgi:hypothetical protein